MLKRVAAFFAAGILLAAFTAAQAASNADCLACHSADGFSKEGSNGKQISLHVDGKEFASSIHGKRLCTDCHVDLKGQPFPHKTDVAPVQCPTCHKAGNTVGAPEMSQADYRDSVHGVAAAKGDGDAPRCKDCHGTHGIKSSSDPKSNTYRTNIPKTCGRCHSDAKITDRHNIKNGLVKSYDNSVHGRLLEKDKNLAAAVCTDCHGVHDIKAVGTVASGVNRANIPETCGKCHSDILEKYNTSVHGKAHNKGIQEAPVCTDCHGEHTIQRPTSPESSVYPTHVATTCAKCHENVRLLKKYGLPANRLKSYTGSFHGVASKFGQTTVANCATCHGAHDILPSSDPGSSVNKKNLPKTCGKCHPGATANFAKGAIHLDPSPTRDRVVFWVGSTYQLFVLAMIASFVGYIMLDLIHRMRHRRRHAEEE